MAPVKPSRGQFAGVASRYQMPENYYAPNAVLTLKDRGDYLEALWERGEVNIIYPVSADECLDRMYWARIRFQRDPPARSPASPTTSSRTSPPANWTDRTLTAREVSLTAVQSLRCLFL